jgi:hypothetical protein
MNDAAATNAAASAVAVENDLVDNASLAPDTGKLGYNLPPSPAVSDMKNNGEPAEATGRGGDDADESDLDDIHGATEQPMEYPPQATLGGDDDDMDDLSDYYTYTVLGTAERRNGEIRKLQKVRHKTAKSLFYQADLERRIQYLEDALRGLRGEIKPKGLRASVGPSQPHKLEIRHMRWEDWKPRPAPVRPSEIESHGLRPDPSYGSVIEVLEEEAVTQQIGSYYENLEATEKDGQPSTPNALSAPMSGSGRPRDSKAPPRLRIRSKILLSNLKAAINSTWGLKANKAVFFRPYKHFMKFEDEIREHFLLLKAKLGIDDPKDGHTPKRHGSSDRLTPFSRLEGQELNDNEAELYTMEAYQHYKLLIRFLDEDLQPLFKLREQIANGTLEKIAFDDLWHLFEVASDVVVPRENKTGEDIFRVLTFTGGRDILHSNWNAPVPHASSTLGPGDWYGAFIVQGWSLNFDGKFYIPVAKAFGIKRYVGERAITDLPVFPLKFHKDPQGLRKALSEQGEIFHNFCKEKNTHRRYRGPYMDEDHPGQVVSVTSYGLVVHTN